jgi:agmatine deiminase
VRKVIWLPGVKAKEITDGHVDFYARFAGDSTVVFALDSDPQSPDYAPTQTNHQILSTATDALGNKITAVPLKTPDFTRVQSAVEARNGWNTGQSFFNTTGFAAGYVGFYLTRSCVLMAQFGDAAADQAAFNVIRGMFPGRAVLQFSTDGVANGGGSIHCTTQQQI